MQRLRIEEMASQFQTCEIEDAAKGFGHRELIAELLPSARVFVVHNDVLAKAKAAVNEVFQGAQAEMVADPDEVIPGCLDLPFKTVFIEGLGTSELSGMTMDGGNALLVRQGCLIHELGPQEYVVYSIARVLLRTGVVERQLVEVQRLSGNDLSGFDLQMNLRMDDGKTAFHLTLVHLFRLMRAGEAQYGAQPFAARFKFKDATGEKQNVKINQIVHVRLKDKYRASSADGGTDAVNWSHRWEVRGHWRRVAGIGKDRDGNYLVKGFTWVSACTKGPEEKAVVKKLRLVSQAA